MANILLSDNGTAILMDLGSANKARVEINTPSQSHILQVQNYCYIYVRQIAQVHKYTCLYCYTHVRPKSVTQL